MSVSLLYFLKNFLNFIFHSFYWALTSAFMIFHVKELFFLFWIFFPAIFHIFRYLFLYLRICMLVFKVFFSLQCLSFFCFFLWFVFSSFFPVRRKPYVWYSLAFSSWISWGISLVVQWVKNPTAGVPVMEQWKWIRLGTMRFWVQSLALLSGLRS